MVEVYLKGRVGAREKVDPRKKKLGQLNPTWLKMHVLTSTFQTSFLTLAFILFELKMNSHLFPVTWHTYSLIFFAHFLFGDFQTWNVFYQRTDNVWKWPTEISSMRIDCCISYNLLYCKKGADNPFLYSKEPRGHKVLQPVIVLSILYRASVWRWYITSKERSTSIYYK
jgi:hypothetical protein